MIEIFEIVFEIIHIILMIIGGILFLSLLYGPFIISFAFLLYLAHVPKHSALFAGFALFGVLGGFLVACLSFRNSPEGPIMYNIPAVFIGEQIYGYAYSYFGPVYTLPFRPIPWILAIPQVYLFTSAVFWGFCGVVAQLIFNKVKELPLIPRDKATLITVFCLIACLIVSGYLIYVIGYTRAYP